VALLAFCCCAAMAANNNATQAETNLGPNSARQMRSNFKRQAQSYLPPRPNKKPCPDEFDVYISEWDECRPQSKKAVLIKFFLN